VTRPEPPPPWWRPTLRTGCAFVVVGALVGMFSGLDHFGYSLITAGIVLAAAGIIASTQ
jgi:hypothetical protein